MIPVILWLFTVGWRAGLLGILVQMASGEGPRPQGRAMQQAIDALDRVDR